ncbi:hypothetical protein HQ520_08960 [bacterium]|nr:hypothetical protein [bacterium]
MAEKINRFHFLKRTGQGLLAAWLGSKARGEAPAFERNAREDGSPEFPSRFVHVRDLEPGMDVVRDIAVDRANRLCVVGSGGLRVLGPDGSLVWRDEDLKRPRCVTVFEDGRVVVGLLDRIVLFDRAGKRAGEWGVHGTGPGEFRYITGVAQTGDFLYVADAGNRRVSRFSIGGDYVDSIEDFQIPSAYFDCEVDGEGYLYVGHTARHQVEKYDANAKQVAVWGRYGTTPDAFCGCCNPTNLTCWKDGRVATAEKGLPRVKALDRTGKVLAYLSPDDLHLSRRVTQLDQATSKQAGKLPCHDDWPGMPLAIDREERLVVSVPGRGLRVFELQPSPVSHGVPGS